MPKEGIILHGTNSNKIDSIKAKGLTPSQGDVFYFSLRVSNNPSQDEYSPDDTKRIMAHLKGAISECLGYAIDSEAMPSIVIAKHPSKHKPSMVSRVEGVLPINISKSIKVKDILIIVSLTDEEVSQARERLKSFRPKTEVVDHYKKLLVVNVLDSPLHKELTEIMFKKVIKNLVKSNRSSQQNDTPREFFKRKLV